MPKYLQFSLYDPWCPYISWVGLWWLVFGSKNINNKLKTLFKERIGVTCSLLIEQSKVSVSYPGFKILSTQCLLPINLIFTSEIGAIHRLSNVYLQTSYIWFFPMVKKQNGKHTVSLRVSISKASLWLSSSIGKSIWVILSKFEKL